MGRCEGASQVDPSEGRQRIAIIGSGIAGQTAAYFLKKKHDVVAVYEAAPRPGLHTHSIQMDGLGAVDVPLRAFSPHYYPNLARLYQHLGVKPQSVNYSSTGTHYNNGQSYFQYYNCVVLKRAIPFVWGQQLGLLSWACTMRIVLDLLWFVASGTYFLYHLERERKSEAKNDGSGETNNKTSLGNITLGAFLKKWNFSYEFVHYFLYPVMSTLLSCSYAQVDAYPAEFILQFYSSRSTTIFTGWNKVPDGVEVVSEKLLQSLGAGVLRLDTKVKFIKPVRVKGKKQVQVTTVSGDTQIFDHVIIATESNIAMQLWVEEDSSVGSDDTMGIVGEAKSAAPKKGSMMELLGSMDSFTAEIVVHNDTTLMPPAKERWSGMNYFSFPSSSIDCAKVSKADLGAMESGEQQPEAGAPLTENQNASMTSVWVNRYVKRQESSGRKAQPANGSNVVKRRSTRGSTPANRKRNSSPEDRNSLVDEEPQEAGDVFQSWNPYHEPNPDTIISRCKMTRAVWTSEGKAAFERCFAPNQGKQNIWLCGSYASPGVTLLEQAVTSSLELAQDFGITDADLPFTPEPCYRGSKIALVVGYCVFYWKTLVLLVLACLGLYLNGGLSRLPF